MVFKKAFFSRLKKYLIKVSFFGSFFGEAKNERTGLKHVNGMLLRTFFTLDPHVREDDGCERDK
ncbi:MAG: hypothetical protein COB98_05200 [Flavobacteriaceae bacterium]|nr:MAG: hypothetical protein COB98_05200 [Flavobacteriaceae bacterium]